VRLEGFGQLKKPMTSLGIETATFRLVAGKQSTSAPAGISERDCIPLLRESRVRERETSLQLNVATVVLHVLRTF
jgi:hypothetical protein